MHGPGMQKKKKKCYLLLYAPGKALASGRPLSAQMRLADSRIALHAILVLFMLAVRKK